MMKTKTLLSISILVFTVLIIAGSCATTPLTQEENIQELFFRAVYSGDISEIKRLIKEGADVNAEIADGYTALMDASFMGYTEIVRLLIKEGAYVNAQDDNKRTALLLALQEGHSEILMLLIEEGADVNVQSKDGTTPLMYALYKDLSDVARLLIERGADIHVRNKCGQTALMFSSQYGHLDIAMLLIEAGADVNAQAETGTTALMFAAQYGQEKIAKFLLESGAHVNGRDNQGATALILASATGHPKVVKLLIAEGADVNARLNNGYTALMVALEYGHLEVARLLVDAEANVNAESKEGYTALMIASSKGYTKFVELLRKRIIEIAVQSKESSYLPFTIEEKDIDEIKYLLWMDNIPSKPYEVIVDEKMVIPARITYVPLTVRQNERTVNDFFEHMQDSSLMIEIQGDNPVICGPYLTTLLRRGELLSTLQHATLIANVPGDKPFVVVDCAINEDSIPIALTLVRNLLFTGESITVRKLNERELDWYWTTISWDITEPIFVFENERHKVMIDFTEYGEIYFVDLFDNLEWGNG